VPVVLVIRPVFEVWNVEGTEREELANEEDNIAADEAEASTVWLQSTLNCVIEALVKQCSSGAAHLLVLLHVLEPA
jgi:hypothetical protein